MLCFIADDVRLLISGEKINFPLEPNELHRLLLVTPLYGQISKFNAWTF